MHELRINILLSKCLSEFYLNDFKEHAMLIYMLVVKNL